MNTALWIGAGVLAAVLLFAGLGKLFVPQRKLAAAPGGGWTADVSTVFLRGLGAIEVLGGLGLILPAVTGIATVLVPVTAVCVVALMIGAAVTHGRRGEIAGVAANLVYLALAVFIAWGRFWLEPFTG